MRAASHTRRPPGPARGFTLVELLVALFALSLLALLGWRGLDGMVRAQSQLQARADQVLALQVGLAQWTADLDAVESLPQVIPVDWNGQVLRLVRRSAAQDSRGADGVVVAAWTLRAVEGEATWLRWQSGPLTRRAQVETAWQQAEAWARAPGDAERAAEVPVVPVAGWAVSYFRDRAWREATPPDDDAGPGSESAGTAGSGGPGSPGAENAAGRALPQGIRLVLTLPAGSPTPGIVTLDWVSPRTRPSRS